MSIFDPVEVQQRKIEEYAIFQLSHTPFEFIGTLNRFPDNHELKVGEIFIGPDRNTYVQTADEIIKINE